MLNQYEYSPTMIYKKFIYRANEASMEALTGSDLQKVAVAAEETSAGMDQWAPGDLKLLSPLAFEWLAAFLSEVEKGKSWPDAFNHGRAAFLAKAEGGSMDPLEHRVLLMLPSDFLMGFRWLFSLAHTSHVT